MDVSGRGSLINLSCLLKRQETAQLLCLPLCHNWYNTQDKDLTSSICLLLHFTFSLSNSSSDSLFQSSMNMSVCCSFMSYCAYSLFFPYLLPYHNSTQSVSSSLHWLQWLHHWLLWPSDSLDLTFRHRVHLLFVSVNTAQGIWSMHRLSIGNTARPVHLCRRSWEDIYASNQQEPKSFFIQLWAAVTQLCGDISWIYLYITHFLLVILRLVSSCVSYYDQWCSQG